MKVDWNKKKVSKARSKPFDQITWCGFLTNELIINGITRFIKLHKEYHQSTRNSLKRYMLTQAEAASISFELFVFTWPKEN